MRFGDALAHRSGNRRGAVAINPWQFYITEYVVHEGELWWSMEFATAELLSVENLRSNL